MTGSDTHGGSDKRPLIGTVNRRVAILPLRQSFRCGKKHISRLAPTLQPNPHVTFRLSLIGSLSVKFKKPAPPTNALAEGH